MDAVTVTTRSESETEGIGRRLGSALPAARVVALRGDLGAGKTVLTRGIARGMGIGEPVTSPTFTIVQEYACPDGRWLYHLDMYRIDGPESALAFGIEEYLFTPDAITVVEWPERIAELLDPGERPVGQTAAGDPGGSGDHWPSLVTLQLDHAGRDVRDVKLPARLAAALGLRV